MRQLPLNTAIRGSAMGANEHGTRQNGMVGSDTQPPGSADQFGGGSAPQRQEAAEYIASLLEGLRLVAHHAQLPFLGYLIGVALEEAKDEKSERD
jgi:hypothetical protein